MSGLASELHRRREHRAAIGAADDFLVEVDAAMRRGKAPVPSMEPTKELLAQDRMWEIRLNIAWVAAALRHTRHEGWKECISVWQPLLDYVNAHPKGHRNALDEVVTDPALREILYRALDTV